MQKILCGDDVVETVTLLAEGEIISVPMVSPSAFLHFLSDEELVDVQETCA